MKNQTACLSKEQEIIGILFKDFLNAYNSRSISKLIGISHAGAFKILKKLEKENIVKAKKIGNINLYYLNYDNPVTEKVISMILTIESNDYKRWFEELKELKEKAEFVILFGSILNDEKNARDIDILVVGEKKANSNIKGIIERKNKLTSKKIHLILQTEECFKKDLKEKNKVIIEVIKKGVILFGQDKFISILK